MKRKLTALALCILAVLLLLCACDENPDAQDGGSQSPSRSDSSSPEGEGSSSPWNASLFESSSLRYNNDLAITAAELSDSAADEKKISNLIQQYGFDGIKTYNYSKSNTLGRFVGENTVVIAHDKLTINGKDTTVLAVIGRGTQTGGESLGDWLKGEPFDGKRSFLDREVVTNIYDYYTEGMKGLENYLSLYPEIKKAENLKILTTGHSLGGAFADIMAAYFTDRIGKFEWWSDMLTKSDIYSYTFGAITVIADSEDANVEKGFENIHNIFNYYDSFAPNGKKGYLDVSSYYAKFGHTEIYSDESLREEEGDMLPDDPINHLMTNYKAALQAEKEHPGMISLSCAREEPEPATAAPATSSDTALDGLYFADSEIEQYFDFTADGYVEMSTLGIEGRGTYRIGGGKLYIEYYTNISPDKLCTWSVDFEKIQDEIIVIGDTVFVREDYIDAYLDSFEDDYYGDEESGELNGTYFSTDGFDQEFTFYGENRVTMSAFGIDADGTYEIRDGKIYVTYTLFGEYTWSPDFEKRGDSLIIAGTEFIKE